MKNLFLSLFFVTLSTPALAQEPEPEIYLQVSCELMSGKNISYDFRFGSNSGGIKEEKTGPVELTLTKDVVAGVHSVSLIAPDDSVELVALLVGFSHTEDILNAVSVSGHGIRLKRVYKNEWYGSTYASEFQDDKHVIFAQPLKCTFD